MGFIREYRHQRQLSLLSSQCESSKRDFHLYRSLRHLINSKSISKHRNLSTTAKANEDQRLQDVLRGLVKETFPGPTRLASLFAEKNFGVGRLGKGQPTSQGEVLGTRLQRYLFGTEKKEEYFIRIVVSVWNSIPLSVRTLNKSSFW